MDSDAAAPVAMNGSAEKHMNGEPVTFTKKPRYRTKQKSNAVSRLSSNILRLIFWSSILYVFFRCPTSPTEVSDNDTAVCKQYVNLRSHLAPHVQPHYDSYVRPYVDKAQPHVHRLNQQVYAPAADFAVKNYNLYVAPRASQAQDYVKSSWEDNVQPLLVSGQHRVVTLYDENLSPHVTKVIEVSNPYIVKAQDELWEVYDGTILPLYDRARPRVEQAYNDGHHLVSEVVFPYLERASASTSALFAGKIWPTLVILYGENVEPQVTRIIERLGRYKDSKKLEAAAEVADISASITAAASSASSVASAASSSIQSEQPRPTIDETVSAEPSQKPDQEAEIRDKLQSDLKRWQEKFAVAAEKGAKDLEERVDDITARQMKFQANAVGETLIVQLDNTINSSFKDLKTYINMSISKLPDDAAPFDEEVLLEKLNASIKSTGEKIRSKAVAVKNWKQNYDNETTSLVQAALESTLEVIDNIRDLGLQEMGMRWAYMEGVTYKDWSRYHELKKTFDQWRNGVEVVALKHQGLLKAQKEGEEIQDKALDVAASAAKELKRLQGVITWKVLAHDSSEDFSSKDTPSRAHKAATPQILESGTPNAEPTDNPVQPASATNLRQADSHTAAKVWGGAMAAFVEGKQVVLPEDSDDWTDQVSSVASQASSAAGSAAIQAQAALSSISAAASLRLSDGLSRASAQYTQARIAVGLQPPPLHEQYLSSAQKAYYEGLGRAHDQYSQFVDAASSAVYGTPTPYIQSVASGASEKIFGTPEPSYKSLLSAATGSYNSAVAAASAKLAEVQTSASSMVGMKSDSSGKKLLASASSQYDAAFTAASAALVDAASSASVAFYGTEPSWNEVAASRASENYNAIIAKASEKIYGTPTPYAASVYNQAGEYAAQATDAAASHYASLRDIVSELVIGKEPDFTESVMNRLSSAYYTGPYAAAASASSLASAAYDSASSMAGVAYDSASSVISTVFTPPAALEGIIDSASQQLQSAVDAASVQIYGTSKGPVQKGASAVADKYDSAKSAASEAIYGTQPSYFEAARSSLEAAASSAQKAASDAIYGTPTGTVEAATSSVAGAYNYATSVVGENVAAAGEYVKDTYASVSSQVSHAVYGPEYGTWESASSRIAAAAASASAQIAKMMEDAGSAATGQADSVKKSAEKVASSVSSAASKASKKVKDEL